jgi:ABC-2 type transport system permease protein
MAETTADSEQTTNETMEGVSRSLHTLWTISKHEFSMYWISPIAYAIGALWIFFSSAFFAGSLGQINQSGGFTGFGGLEPSMRYVLQPMSFLLMFLAPALTMRLVADEIRTGTHELLLTSPVRDWEIIVGKWLGVVGVFTVFLLVSMIYPLILVWRGTPNMDEMIAGYLGYWLWAGTILAIGVLASAMTQYQLIAFLIGEGIALFLFIASFFTDNLITNPTISEALSQLNINAHFRDTMLTGVIKWVDLAYYFGLIAICLFIATQILNMRRWRA